MKTKIKSILMNILDFFLPSHCMSCERAVKNGDIICTECEKAIERVKAKICIKCGRTEKMCDCHRFVYHFDAVAAPFFNEGIAQRGLYKMKFHSAKPVVSFYTDAMIECLYKHFSGTQFDGITYVPMNFIKESKRGYNQAKWLAESISEKLGIPLVEDVLKRSIISKVQHKSKGITTRFLNAYKGYGKKGRINGGRILLIDDIKTTGASLDACSRQLLYAGADEVICLTALISNKNS